MEIKKTEIEGVYIIEPQIFKDERGYFYESFNKNIFEKETGVKNEFLQDNQSKSSYGVLRGLHFQKNPYAQGKLVRVVNGKVLDVAVDIRKSSPTYGKHVAVELSGENNRQLYIPRGFAHGFIVLSNEAIFQYKCDAYWNPDSEGTILWNDPDININWKIDTQDIIISKKDQNGVYLKDLDSSFD